MKTKTFLLICLLLGFSMTQLSAQTLKKGAVVAVSTYELILSPDVSMNQFIDFYNNKYIPEYEKNFPGVKMYPLMGDRGENKNIAGGMLVFESVAVRDKYYPKENEEVSEITAAANEKMQAIGAEATKLVVVFTRETYTDWIVK